MFVRREDGGLINVALVTSVQKNSDTWPPGMLHTPWIVWTGEVRFFISEADYANIMTVVERLGLL